MIILKVVLGYGLWYCVCLLAGAVVEGVTKGHGLEFKELALVALATSFIVPAIVVVFALAIQFIVS